MFVVALFYLYNGAVDVTYSRIFTDIRHALSFASEKRRRLNSHWLVEVCELRVVSSKCVLP